ncbi:MAG TPA: FAD binding domain-containing protein [Terriglobales bacterium]|jgi:4-hydroxybenzoyl-CoA reductase subunit beta|nr:FAD binding domain-containing protein [Terriglobales bacterium]
MSLPAFKLLRPRTIAEAVEQLASHSGKIQILAGGTDLIPSMKQRLFEPEFVLDIGGIEELHKIRVVPGLGMEIGALTTLSKLEDSEFVRRSYPVLHEAVKTVASPLLRNMGTLGGNICLDTRCVWYNQSLTWRKSCGFCIKKDGDLCHVAPGGTRCWAVFSGDTPAALLCLNAELEIAGSQGFRRIPLQHFYTGLGEARMKLGPTELLVRVFLPESYAGWRGAYKKLRIRGSIDYPLAGVAVALKKPGNRVEDARVALTAVNPVPCLVPEAPHALIGKIVDEYHATVVGELAAHVARPLTTSALTPEYRREMIKVFARRAVLEAAKNQNGSAN